MRALTPRIGHLDIPPSWRQRNRNRPRNQLKPTLRPCAVDPASRVVTMEALSQVGGRPPRNLLVPRRQQTQRPSGTRDRARRQHPRPSLRMAFWK